MMAMEDIIYRLAIYLPGFLFAIVCHEWAHGYVALKYGDNTAQSQGRLTLNPLAHMDMVGTVIWPLVCLFLGGVIFGYAKPVPVNPNRFKNYRQGLFWVSFAGPGMNILIGVFCSLCLAVVVTQLSTQSSYYVPMVRMLDGAIMINFVLAVFNLIPFPPLDGSKMVTSFLDYENARKFESLERYALLFLLVLWFSNIARYIFFPADMARQYLPVFFARILS